MSDVICNECDREFANKNGLSIHKSVTHDQPSKVEVECVNCGDRKTLTRSKTERSENNFCNNECYSEWVSGETHPRWNREKVSCSNCGNTKKVPQSEIEDHDMFFCDYNCSSEWQSENRMGKNHPKWKDDAIRALDYGEEWTVKRRKFVSQTEDICCKCNEEEIELERGLNVHHIIRPEKFSNINEAHQKQNMMKLCDSCHPQVENLEVQEQFEYHPSSNGEWVGA